jgi:hypothetical protein
VSDAEAKGGPITESDVGWPKRTKSSAVCDAIDQEYCSKNEPVPDSPPDVIALRSSSGIRSASGGNADISAGGAPKSTSAHDAVSASLASGIVVWAGAVVAGAAAGAVVSGAVTGPVDVATVAGIVTVVGSDASSEEPQDTRKVK